MAYIVLQVLDLYNECNLLTSYNCRVDVGDIIRIGCYVYWNDGTPANEVPIKLRFTDVTGLKFNEIFLSGRSDSNGWFAENHTVTASDLEGLGSSGYVCVFPYTTESDSADCRQVLFHSTCNQMFYIIDSDTGIGIPVATVIIKSGTTTVGSCTTDAGGVCTVSGLTQGSAYTVTVSKQGYETHGPQGFIACTTPYFDIYLVPRTPTTCTQVVEAKDMDSLGVINGVTISARPDVGTIVSCTTGDGGVAGRCNLTLLQGVEYDFYVSGLPTNYVCESTTYCEHRDVNACTTVKTFYLKSTLPPLECIQSVRVMKKNDETPISNVLVSAYEDAITLKDSAYTNIDGECELSLTRDQYYVLRCTKLPLDYECVDKIIQIACDPEIIFYAEYKPVGENTGAIVREQTTPPTYAEPGTEISIPTTIKNAGSENGEYRMILINDATDEIIDIEPCLPLATSALDCWWKNLDPGEEYSNTLSTNWVIGAMPDYDWQLRIEVREQQRDPIADDTYRFTIFKSGPAGHVLILDTLPSEVIIGSELTFTGQLTKEGEPVSGATIVIKDKDLIFGDEVASGSTDDNGEFAINWIVASLDITKTAEIYAEHLQSGATSGIQKISIVKDGDGEGLDIKKLAIYSVAAVGIYAGGSALPGKAGKVVPILAIIPTLLAVYEGYKIIKEGDWLGV